MEAEKNLQAEKKFAKEVVNYLQELDARYPTALVLLSENKLGDLGATGRLFYNLNLDPDNPLDGKKGNLSDVAIDETLDAGGQLTSHVRDRLDNEVTLSYEPGNLRKIGRIAGNNFSSQIEKSPEWKEFWTKFCETHEDKDLQKNVRDSVAGAVAYKLLLQSNKLDRMDFDKFKFLPPFINSPGNVEKPLTAVRKRVIDGAMSGIDSESIIAAINRDDKKYVNEKIEVVSKTLLQIKTNKEFSIFGDPAKIEFNNNIIKYLGDLSTHKSQLKILNDKPFNQISELILKDFSDQYSNKEMSQEMKVSVKQVGEAAMKMADKKTQKKYQTFMDSLSVPSPKLASQAMASQEKEVKIGIEMPKEGGEKPRMNRRDSFIMKKRNSVSFMEKKIESKAESKPEVKSEAKFVAEENKQDEKTKRNSLVRKISSLDLGKKVASDKPHEPHPAKMEQQENNANRITKK